MNNNAALNGKPTVAPADLPVQRKSLAGTSADPILPEPTLTDNRRRAEALAHVYRLILSQERVQP